MTVLSVAFRRRHRARAQHGNNQVAPPATPHPTPPLSVPHAACVGSRLLAWPADRFDTIPRPVRPGTTTLVCGPGLLGMAGALPYLTITFNKARDFKAGDYSKHKHKYLSAHGTELRRTPWPTPMQTRSAQI